MFCNEAIKEVYECFPDCPNDVADCWLDCSHDMAYHVTRGYRLILKTENYYICLGYDGVMVLPGSENIVLPGEYMEPCIERLGDDEEEMLWVGFESTLFVGEHLHAVREKNGLYEAEFDDFTLKIIPYENGEDIKRQYNQNCRAYKHVYGCERHIKRKCACGGTGEIFLDFVSDYIVRCNQCHKSTWAGINVIDAIEDWNAGKTPCDASGIESE